MTTPTNAARGASASAPHKERQVVPAEPAMPSPPALAEFRLRMNAIGEALTALVVGAEPAESDLWGRGIYLKLVGKLCQVLDSDDLSLAELEALSKMICEQRKAHSHAMEVRRRVGTAAGRDDDDAPREAGLGAHLGQIVKQLYGVNLEREADSPSDK
ncbi:MAG: hypothetical protein KJ749_05365 [Planctomycetes bacterium]|nr:hypothetical protein [Planctomycetota bacterium]